MKTIINKMKKISSEQALPKAYKEDLEIDFSELSKNGTACDHWVWLIRDHGSLLVPCHVGASSISLEFYIKEDKSIKLFVIDTYQGTIESIDAPRAVSLVNGSLCSKHNLSRLMFNKVIERGLKLGLWGLFTVPNSEDLNDPRFAFAYFKAQNNKRMADFCISINNLKTA